MAKYLLALPLLWACSALASDIVVYPHGTANPGICVPGFRTYSTTSYITSRQNVSLLKELGHVIPQLRIAGFSSASPGETALLCRLSFPVYLPGKVAHEVYLAESMRAELSEAGLYADTAPVALLGHLVSMDFNSFGTGKWVLEARFSVEGKEPVTIKYEHGFPLGVLAVQACRDVTHALVPAMQGFLFTVYSDPKFQNLLRPTGSSTATSGRPQEELAGSIQSSDSGGQRP